MLASFYFGTFLLFALCFYIFFVNSKTLDEVYVNVKQETRYLFGVFQILFILYNIPIVLTDYWFLGVIYFIYFFGLARVFVKIFNTSFCFGIYCTITLFYLIFTPLNYFHFKLTLQQLLNLFK